MRSIKCFALAIVMFSAFSCSNKTERIDAFHNALGNDSVDAILANYFTFPDATAMNSLKSTYITAFGKIQSNMALGAYEVIKYKKARKSWNNIPLVTDGIDQSQIYVVKYSNGDLMYVYFSGDKIQSLLPAMKGDVISGWF